MGLTELGLLFCAAVWGSTFALTKNVLDGVDPIIMVAYRFLLAAAVLFPAFLARKKMSQFLGESALLAVLLTILYVTQTVGLFYTSAANSGFITGLFVLFVPLFLFIFFRKVPSLLELAAAGLAVCGLWLLTGGVEKANRGDALTVLAAAAYAAHLLATDKYVKAEADVVLLAFHQFWMTGLMALAIAASFGASWRVETRSAGGAIVFLALLPTIAAFFIQMRAQKSASPLKVSLIFSLEPVFAAAFAWTWGGERFALARAAGGAVIVAGMILGEMGKFSLLRGRQKEVLPV